MIINEEETINILEICRTLDPKKTKSAIENFNGKINSLVIMNICLSNPRNIKQQEELFKIIDLLLEYYPNKVEMFSEDDYNYQLNKGIYNGVYLQYAYSKTH